MSMTRHRLLDNTYKKTAEGEQISVKSVARMYPGLTLYGKSEQETTTGAQLVDFISAADADITQNGVTVTNNGDGSFAVTGTPTVTEGIVFTYYFARNVVLPDGDYYFNASIQLLKKDGSSVYYYNHTFSYNSVTDNEIRLYWQKNAQTYIDGETIYPMLNSGTTALPWEPYTGGAPSPSPDYPQEIKSVGDSGTINVTLSGGGSQSQTLPVQTPNGLPGIPVDSGGNYTDASGQQWVCDEVDFERGVYVQRCAKEVVTGTPNFSETPDVSGRFIWNVMYNTYKKGGNVGLASFARWSSWSYPSSNADCFCISNNVLYFTPSTTMTAEEVNALFSEMIASENPPYTIGQLATPVETPLSPSDLAAYKALRTYSPTTVVNNDAGAWMKFKYKTRKSLEVNA